MKLPRVEFGAPEIEQAFLDANLRSLPTVAYEQFASYLALLLRWNRRFNLTSMRTPEEIVQRHFVECSFFAQQVPSGCATLLDYGSGAGFPGIPVAICRPQIRVTLGEAQGKKAAFLREAGRVLDSQVVVYEGRVEAMAANRHFEAVALRAVEQMDLAISVAANLATQNLMLLTTVKVSASLHELAPDFDWDSPLAIPNSEQRVVAIGHR